jgi:hypothetical protein
MAILLHAPLAQHAALLDAYADEFDWYCFCLVCGHLPAGSDDTLQALYQLQARWRGNRMQELFPLVCAHWDVVNLAREMARTHTEPERRPLERLLRLAKAHHRKVVRDLRATWRTLA